MRNADELSMTTHPAAAAFGAKALAVSPPAENSAISAVEKSNLSSASIFKIWSSP
jgi:hypothetical protein